MESEQKVLNEPIYFFSTDMPSKKARMQTIGA